MVSETSKALGLPSLLSDQNYLPPNLLRKAMKISFSTLFCLALGVSLANAVASPMMTSVSLNRAIKQGQLSNDKVNLQAPQVQKRQSLPSGDQLSSLLADPSAALSEASALLQNPAISSLFTSLTADPAFQSEISSELVSQYGSASASSLLGLLSSSLGGVAPTATASGSTASISSTPATTTTSSSGGGSSTDGSSSPLKITLTGSAIYLGVAALLLAM